MRLTVDEAAALRSYQVESVHGVYKLWYVHPEYRQLVTKLHEPPTLLTLLAAADTDIGERR